MSNLPGRPVRSSPQCCGVPPWWMLPAHAFPRPMLLGRLLELSLRTKATRESTQRQLLGAWVIVRGRRQKSGERVSLEGWT